MCTLWQKQKLQNRYTGPYIVDSVKSYHLIVLRDEQNRILKTPVHINRLKMAYVRKPTPLSYFMPHVVTNEQQEQRYGSNDSQITDSQGLSQE